jgi:uncharacterized protein
MAAHESHSDAVPAAGWTARLLIGLIRAYQLTLSPWFGAGCRYLPSCSAYASEAVSRHGALAGGWLAARRIVRCNPWGGHGYDPVPEPASSARAVEAANSSTEAHT